MTQLHLCKSSSLQVHSLILCSTSHSSTTTQHQYYLQQETSASTPYFRSVLPSLSSLPICHSFFHTIPILKIFLELPSSCISIPAGVCGYLSTGRFRVHVTHLHGTSTLKSRWAMPSGTRFLSWGEENAHLRKWWILQTTFRVRSTSLSGHAASELYCPLAQGDGTRPLSSHSVGECKLSSLLYGRSHVTFYPPPPLDGNNTYLQQAGGSICDSQGLSWGSGRTQGRVSQCTRFPYISFAVLTSVG